MISPIALWPPIVGAALLVSGLAVLRRGLSASSALDKVIAAAGVFFAVPLAVFGTQHLIIGQFIQSAVPPWMPWRLFWAYFVGVALIAAALSFLARKYVRLSAPLLAVMIFLFVLLIHIPNVVKDPGNRILWVVAIRDTCFAAGGLLLAGITSRAQDKRRAAWMILAGRLAIGLALIFFGVEHLLHPEYAPGVPLAKITPAWVPFARFWGYLVGSVLLASGVAIVTNRFARQAATWVGVVMLALTVGLYLPIFLMASGTDALVEGVDYVADTMLFAGAVLLLAEALGEEIPMRIVKFPSAA
jgi:uncharacterized membrane protein